VLIVSHKLGILPVIDKILVLRDGRVDMFGTRDEILPKIAPQTVRRVPATAGGKA
jgi:ATP-binding cassette subfamily C exporter for protease/lipase